MRPLAILILVLGALAALFFALSSDAERGGRGTPSVPDLQDPMQEDLQDEELIQGRPPEIKTAVGGASSRNGMLHPTDPNSSFKGFITGQVTDSNNFSVADAKIKLINLPADALIFEGSMTLLGKERASSPVATIQSLPNGSFAFDGIEASERWGLVVSHPNYSTTVVAPLVVPENGGLKNQLIVLVPGNTLFGSVIDADSGAAIPGANLALTSPVATFRKADRSGAGRQEVIADGAGAYRFMNTDRSTKTLTIRAPGYATAILTNFVAVPAEKVIIKPTVIRGRIRAPEPEPDQGVKVVSRQFDILMKPGMSIAGRVLDPDGVGLENVDLQAFCLTSSTGSHGKTISLKGGEFLLDDLGEGQYTISVAAKGFQCLPIQRVKAGTTDLTIELIEQGGVAGKALNDATGRALRKFSCTARTHNVMNITWGQVIKTRHFTDRGNGSFSIGGLPAGDYVIEVQARGLASSFSTPFSVTPGEQTRDINIRVTEGGTLRGVVVDKRSGKPMPGVTLRTWENNHLNAGLMLALGDSGRSAASRREIKTAEDGTFELKLMTPGTYQVELQMAGFSAIFLNDVRIGDGEETALPAFGMEKGALLQGYVLNSNRSPISGASVMLVSKDGGSHWSRRNARTDGDGHYVMRNVQGGNYELSATRPRKVGAGFLSGALDMKKSSIEIFLEEGSINAFDLDFEEKKL